MKLFRELKVAAQIHQVKNQFKAIKWKESRHRITPETKEKNAIEALDGGRQIQVDRQPSVEKRVFLKVSMH